MSGTGAKVVRHSARVSRKDTRHSSISQTKVRSARVRLERLATVGEFATCVAHDVNNSLTSALISAQYLQAAVDLEPELQQHADNIVNATRHAESLLRQVLTYATCNPALAEIVDLGSFVAQKAQFFKTLLPSNIEFSTPSDTVSHLVEVDSSQLQQVLTNLVLNAGHAMPDGGTVSVDVTSGPLPVHVSPAASATERAWVGLSISDTGTGIAPHVMPRIFDLFFTTKGPVHGSGLGLSQVRELVAQNGGHVSVESAPGCTRFTIYLPKAEHECVQRDSAGPSRPVEETRTVLIVDDEPTVQKSLAFLVEQLGYRSLLACNAFEALESYEQHHNQITHVMCDVGIPGLCGVELARLLLEREGPLSIILMSGRELSSGASDLTQHERVSWMPKPLHSQALCEKLDPVGTRELRARKPTSKEAC